MLTFGDCTIVGTCEVDCELDVVPGVVDVETVALVGTVVVGVEIADVETVGLTIVGTISFGAAGNDGGGCTGDVAGGDVGADGDVTVVVGAD